MEAQTNLTETESKAIHNLLTGFESGEVVEMIDQMFDVFIRSDEFEGMEPMERTNFSHLTRKAKQVFTKIECLKN